MVGTVVAVGIEVAGTVVAVGIAVADTVVAAGIAVPGTVVAALAVSTVEAVVDTGVSSRTRQDIDNSPCCWGTEPLVPPLRLWTRLLQYQFLIFGHCTAAYPNLKARAEVALSSSRTFIFPCEIKMRMTGGSAVTRSADEDLARLHKSDDLGLTVTLTLPEKCLLENSEHASQFALCSSRFCRPPPLSSSAEVGRTPNVIRDPRVLWI